MRRAFVCDHYMIKHPLLLSGFLFGQGALSPLFRIGVTVDDVEEVVPKPNYSAPK